MQNESIRFTKGVNMKIIDHKAIIYSTVFLVILLTWLILCAGSLSAFSMLNTALLIILSYIAMVFDINTGRIPNKLVLLMIACWLLLIVPMLVTDTINGFRLLADSIYGMLIGGGLFLLVYLVSRKGLGGGDVKFMAAAGLYLGFAGTIPVILYGSVLAALSGLVLILLNKISRKDAIPLAPFLFTGIIITIFTPPL